MSEGNPRINEFNDENSIEYHYRYAIDESKSQGPVMDRWEHRVGEYVKGAYSVLDPDGRIRTVDYEVDGKKGYHAVIRMNEPSPELLSIQQLAKSSQLFPDPVLPTSPPNWNFTPSETRTGKWLNYHSKTPYYNQLGSKTDNKVSATSQISKSLSPPDKSLKNLPIGPANYNVPQTTNLIYFRRPAGNIIISTNFKPEKSEEVKEKRVENIPEHTSSREVNDIAPEVPIIPETEPTIPRRRRNSRLVRRYKSFAEVFS